MRPVMPSRNARVMRLVMPSRNVPADVAG